jgi:hypothetical protein
LTTSLWYEPLPAYLWQVFLHSLVMSVVLFAWARRIRLPSGRTRRILLAATLVLPLATAAVPGRSGFEFREQLAWFDSARLLKLPLGWGLQIHHVALFAGLLVCALTLWQELVPLLRRPALAAIPAPERWVRRARELCGWQRCEVLVEETPDLSIATSGTPWRPQLVLGRGALEALSTDELDAVIRHENAHWIGRRWWVSHILYVLRLVQPFNPVAMWCFREYIVELEIDCDEDAAHDSGGRTLAGVLFRIYESTDERDLAGRSILRRRIEALLGDLPRSRHAIPAGSMAVVIAAFALVLPWLV